jgi:cytochrome c
MGAQSGLATTTGDSGATLINPPGKTERTMALYVPTATTIFDFTRRAMPWPQPKSLTRPMRSRLSFLLAGNKVIG